MELASVLGGIEAVLRVIEDYTVEAFWFPLLLLGVGAFFTVYLKFPQIKYFKHAWKVVTGKYTPKDSLGDTSHFQALSTALAGTVGTGNLGGVAFAIFLGGPAAIFWMWMTAFLGMTTKFVEVTISHKYRTVDSEGHIAGGPMFVMDRALNMKWLAVAFAVATLISAVIGGGNMPQSNNIAVGMQDTFGIPLWATAGVLAILLGLVIIGGIKRIAQVTVSLVPFMGALYFVAALAVTFSNLENIIPSFLVIFENAFTGSAAAGGFLGASFAYAFNRGVDRGLFSNEAGQGSAPIAHASSRGESPVAEGMVSILEPFIDTIVICTLTAMVILSSGVWTEKFDNEFEHSELVWVEGEWDETDPEQAEALYGFLVGVRDVSEGVRPLTAELEVIDGRIQQQGFTTIHKRSIAENLRVFLDGEPFTGVLPITDGRSEIFPWTFRGESLVHSIRLTLEAFKKSFIGDYAPYVVTIGLLMFAFSTAIVWAYYGDRALLYLGGERYLLPYRLLYVAFFFLGAFADTGLIWLVSAVCLPIMAVPNLISIALLRREMRDEVDKYWTTFDARELVKKNR